MIIKGAPGFCVQFCAEIRGALKSALPPVGWGIAAQGLSRNQTAGRARVNALTGVSCAMERPNFLRHRFVCRTLGPRPDS